MFTQKTTVDGVLGTLNKAVGQLIAVQDLQQTNAIAAADQADNLIAVSRLAQEEADRAGRVITKLAELLS